MMSSLLLIMSVCGFSLGLTACGIFLFSNKSNAHANRLMAISLFSLATVMVVTFLLEWNIDYFAYVYRFPSPFMYLLLPTSYLYLRAVLNNEHRFRKWDVLHFLPALMHLVEMLPFYLSSYDTRRLLAREILVNPGKLIESGEGLLPPYYHTVLRCLQGVIYVSLMVKLLVETRRTGKPISLSQVPIYRWLITLTCLIAVLAIPMVFFFLSPKIFFINGTRFLLMVISFSFLIINLYLFFKPQILYGIPDAKYINELPAPSTEHWADGASQTEDLKTVESSELSSSFVNLEYYKPILELYISREKPFLKQGYTISDLSSDTGIPQHHLSALLNRVYEMRFTDFLNRMRIDYIRENFNHADWRQLTLEGIARLAGFNSRTTFFNAIKKATGLTPSEFIAEVKNPSKEKESSID